MKKFAVLFAPRFRLQAALRADASSGQGAAAPRPSPPVALLDHPGGKSHVIEFNSAAAKFRIEKGLTPTQALARCALLRLVFGNAGQEQSIQETLLQAAGNLSPFMESTSPGVVTVELPSNSNPSADELTRRCLDPLRLLGLSIQLGVADTPDLARLAARLGDPIRIVDCGSEFLGPLPLEVLEPTPELALVLDSWGLRTIGQFLQLPMLAVCERLGPEALQLWEQARGGRVRPLQLRSDPEVYAEETDLDYPLELLEPLLFLLRRFLEQILQRLSWSYRVVGQLRLTLKFVQGPAYQRSFHLPQPSGDVDLLFRLLQTHLENFTSESPIIHLSLSAEPALPIAEQFGLLEKGLRNPHQFTETLARLQALLGEGRVGSPEVEPSHHPEAFHLQPPVIDSTPPATGAKKLRLLGLPWLRFRPPIRSEVALEGGSPAFLSSSRSTGPILEARGPWLREGRWWESPSWSREEWDVALADGQYRLVRIPEGWFLEGIYA